jgi:hypothetical protein
MGIREHETQINYGLVGRKLLLSEVMDRNEKNLVLEIATKFASDLVEEKVKNPYGPLQMSGDAKNHMNMIVLDRVLSLYQSGSTIMFDNLKKTVCESLLIEGDHLSNERLHTFLSSGLDEYFDNEVSGEVGKSMGFIRGVVESIFPDRI